MTRWKLAVTALPGVVLLCVGAFPFVASSAPNPSANSQANGEANGHRDFVVSGQVEGLRPGGTEPMVLTVRNPNSVAIRVTRLTVTAGAASAGCPASSLTLPNWTGSLQVPKDGTASLTVSVTLKATASNACQDARWPLTYGGQAEKA